MNLAGSDLSACSHNLGHDGCVVPRAGAKVKHTIAWRQGERVEVGRQGPRVAIAEVTGAVKRDNDIVVNTAGIGVGGDNVLRGPGHHVRYDNLPRSRPQKLLTRYGCESLNERGRSQVGRELDLFRVKAAALLEVEHSKSIS